MFVAAAHAPGLPGPVAADDWSRFGAFPGATGMAVRRDGHCRQAMMRSITAFETLPAHLRTCAHIVYQELRATPDLEQISEEDMLDIITSDTFRPALETRAAQFQADLRVRGIL